MPGPASESHGGPRDVPPPFPPPRAYPHLTAYEYHVLKAEYEAKHKASREDGRR